MYSSKYEFVFAFLEEKIAFVQVCLKLQLWYIILLETMEEEKRKVMVKCQQRRGNSGEFRMRLGNYIAQGK